MLYFCGVGISAVFIGTYYHTYMKKLSFVLAALLLSSFALKAQNFQIFYDFGSDRKQVTTTAEIFKADSWGNTFSFIDLDYTFKNEDGKNVGIGGAYMEIARCLNFWQNSKASFFSIQLEYNGGLGTYAYLTKATDNAFSINHAFLAGADFFLHSKNFNNLFNLKVLYKKYIDYKQDVPMQFTFVWTCNNLFGAKGLTFSGFADYWWQYQDADNFTTTTHTVFLSEPQLWYAVGQHFGCPNLNIGGEIELSYNFAQVSGFKCRPCLGIKWDFAAGVPNKKAATAR